MDSPSSFWWPSRPALAPKHEAGHGCKLISGCSHTSEASTPHLHQQRCLSLYFTATASCYHPASCSFRQILPQFGFCGVIVSILQRILPCVRPSCRSLAIRRRVQHSSHHFIWTTPAIFHRHSGCCCCSGPAGAPLHRGRAEGSYSVRRQRESLAASSA